MAFWAYCSTGSIRRYRWTMERVDPHLVSNLSKGGRGHEKSDDDLNAALRHNTVTLDRPNIFIDWRTWLNVVWKNVRERNFLTDDCKGALNIWFHVACTVLDSTVEFSLTVVFWFSLVLGEDWIKLGVNIDLSSLDAFEWLISKKFSRSVVSGRFIEKLEVEICCMSPASLVIRGWSYAVDWNAQKSSVYDS